MNYLAHAWLARHSDDAILGALLGDFVFGQSTLVDWPEPARAERKYCDGPLQLVGSSHALHRE